MFDLKETYRVKFEGMHHKVGIFATWGKMM